MPNHRELCVYPSTTKGAARELQQFLLGQKLNLLLLAFPLAVACRTAQATLGEAPVFVLSLLALCPLAERLGFITEQLACYTNDTLGGLLNASFGNATELIICGFALHHGLLRIVQLSLLGSVVSNLLLVLGSAFIAGGLRGPTQTFNREGISVNCGLLLLSSVSVLLPSLLKATHTGSTLSTAPELALSRAESVLLLVSYVGFLLFQLYTHSHLFDEGRGEDDECSSSQLITGGSAAPPYKCLPTSEGPVPGLPPSPPRQLRQASHHSHKDKGPGAQFPQTPAIGEHPQPAGSNLVSWPSLAHSSSLQRREIQMQDVEISQGSGGSSMNPLMRRTNSGRRAAAIQAAEEAEASVRRTPSQARSSHVTLEGEHSKDDLSQGRTTDTGSDRQEHEEDHRSEQEGDAEEMVLSVASCFVWLAVVTACIALLSEWIMDAIEGASKSLHVPLPFLTTILLPIVGNAAEHASALVFAYRNRIEIALGVAVGSATQIAVMVIPFCVVLAWIFDKDLDLNFNAFEAATYFISILLAAFTVNDGSGNWLKGLLLIFAYIFVSVGFWYHKDPDLAREEAASEDKHA